MSQDLDKWIEIAKGCKYLPENELKVKTLAFIYFKSELKLKFLLLNLMN